MAFQRLTLTGLNGTVCKLRQSRDVDAGLHVQVKRVYAEDVRQRRAGRLLNKMLEQYGNYTSLVDKDYRCIVEWDLGDCLWVRFDYSTNGKLRIRIEKDF